MQCERWLRAGLQLYRLAAAAEAPAAYERGFARQVARSLERMHAGDGEAVAKQAYAAAAAAAALERACPLTANTAAENPDMLAKDFTLTRARA
jgi:hypothetical protein